MTTRILRVLTTAGKQQSLNSADHTLDFLSVKVGASALEMKETTGHFDFSAKRLTNLAAPSGTNDAATKAYVDGVAAGFDPKESVRAATAAALPAVTAAGSGVGKTLTADANGALVIDGVTLNDGDRVLVKDQVAGADNGIYAVTDKGSGGSPFILTRATDFDGSPSNEVTNGAFMLVTAGTNNGGEQWFLTTNTAITVDTTSLAFSQASTGAVVSVNGLNGVVVLDTDDISEGSTNLYYTNARFDTRFGTKDTDDLSEGATNLYYTDTRAKTAAVGDAIVDGVTDVAPSQNAVYDALLLKYEGVSSKTNDNAGTITQGQIVYLKSNGNVDLARANASGTTESVLYAVLAASIATTASGSLHRTRGDIVTVSGASFTVGGTVFLSAATAGAVTQTAPSTTGQFIVPLGRAISATTFEWQPEEPSEII